MHKKIYTVEELMADNGFLDYCLQKQAADKDFWQKEIALHPEQLGVFEEARYMISLLHGKLEKDEISRQVEKVRQQIKERKEITHVPHPDSQVQESFTIGADYIIEPARPKRKFMVYGIAAGVLVFLSVYLFKYALPRDKPPVTVTATITDSSGMGKRKTILLADGTTVILNSNSRISYTNEYNQHTRDIVLDGEAFFQVAKDPSKPFIVHSGHFTTTALGTAFYVYAGYKLCDYKVDLLEGKVQLETDKVANTSPERKTQLLPGHRASWDPDLSIFSGNACDTIKLQQWVTGRLSFKQLPASAVFRLLEQWYSIKISVLNSKLGNVSLTGDYNNESLENILKVVCFSLSCRYTFVNDEVIIE